MHTQQRLPPLFPLCWFTLQHSLPLQRPVVQPRPNTSSLHSKYQFLTLLLPQRRENVKDERLKWHGGPRYPSTFRFPSSRLPNPIPFSIAFVAVLACYTDVTTSAMVSISVVSSDTLMSRRPVRVAVIWLLKWGRSAIQWPV